MALYSNGKQLGKNDAGRFVYIPCPQCGKERWIRIRDYKNWQTNPPMCRSCSPCKRFLKFGGWKTGDGYVNVLLRTNDFFFPMVRKNSDSKIGGYVFEHRLVMAKHLGRCLHSWELVHHKNHIRDDNRIENLQLISSDKHNQLTLMESRITRLEDKVAEQTKQIRLLKWQLRESQKEVQHRSI